MDILSKDLLVSLLNYNSYTGVFNWIKRNQNVAGYTRDTGYVKIKVQGKEYFAHRLVWLFVHGRMPTNEIDHINGIRNDNRLANLREATGSQNQRNRAINKNNTSGYTGIYWQEKTKKFRVCFKINGKRISAGSFSKIEHAILARKKAYSDNGFHKNHGRKNTY